MSHEESLAAFRQWDVVPPLTRLPTLNPTAIGDTAHVTHLITAQGEIGERLFILRKHRDDSVALGFSQRHQASCMREAARHQLAPMPVWQSSVGHDMVMEHVAASGQPDPEDLAVLMTSIHRLPLVGPQLDIAARIDQYRQVALKRGVPSELLLRGDLKDIQQRLTSLNQGPIVMCHNDLHPDNMVKNDTQLLALDWEYAAPGSPYFDAAAAVAGWPKIPVEPFLIRVLGEGYCRRRWREAQCLYRVVSWNWHWAAGYTPGDAEDLQKIRATVAGLA